LLCHISFFDPYKKEKQLSAMTVDLSLPVADLSAFLNDPTSPEALKEAKKVKFILSRNLI
jgi:hypothetical protein